MLEFNQLGQALDGAVVVDQFAQYATWVKACEDRKVNCGLGVARAFENSAGSGTQGKYVPRLHELLGP